MSEYPFTIRLLSTDDGGGYLVEFPDLPGCMSDGESIEEAIANGEEAKRDWIAAMQEAGRAIPPPSVEATDGYSGKWQLRTPKSLHRRLAECARHEGVSLNTLVVTLLAEGLARNRHSRPSQQMTSSAPRAEAEAPRSNEPTSRRRPRRGTAARLVEEVLQSNSPRALRPAEIRNALQRDKGVSMAFTSIRYALGQLEERHAVEQAGDRRSWRHHGSGAREGGE